MDQCHLLSLEPDREKQTDRDRVTDMWEKKRLRKGRQTCEKKITEERKENKEWRGHTTAEREIDIKATR